MRGNHEKKFLVVAVLLANYDRLPVFPLFSGNASCRHNELIPTNVHTKRIAEEYTNTHSHPHKTTHTDTHTHTHIDTHTEIHTQ